METPDIIYLSPYKQGEGQDYIGLAWTHPSEFCNHVPYVRRDLIDGMIRDMKELIRAEIERRFAKYDEHYTSAGKELNDLLFFIKDLMKQEEPVSEDLEEATEGEWIWATTPPEKPGKYKVQLRYDTYSAIWNGVKWIDDETGFQIMGVFKWKPIKEEQQ